MNDVYPKECFIFFAVHTPLFNLQKEFQNPRYDTLDLGSGLGCFL